MKLKRESILWTICILIFFTGTAIALRWTDYDNFSSGQIADTDTFHVRDISVTEGSGSAQTVKEFSWATMKADLKTYFDTLYATFSVDDTPTDSDTTDAISSNWAYDHENGSDPHTGYVLESLFDAYTVLYATSDNTPAALSVTEQTVVGRATGGAIAALAIDSDLSSVSGSDDTVPSAKATKSALDGKQASDTELTALAGLTSAANTLPYFTGAGTAGTITSSANMVSLLGSADYATARTNLGTPYTTASDCSGITAGCCLDTDDGILYCYDGDSVEITGTLTFAPIASPTFTGTVTMPTYVTMPNEGKLRLISTTDEHQFCIQATNNGTTFADIVCFIADTGGNPEMKLQSNAAFTGLGTMTLQDEGVIKNETDTSDDYSRWQATDEAGTGSAAQIDVIRVTNAGEGGEVHVGIGSVGAGNYWKIDQSGDMTAVGTAKLSSPIATASKSSAYTIGTDSPHEAYGGVIYVTSAAVITAPAVTAGMSFTVVTIGAIAVSLDVNASDKMYLDGVLLDDGDKATNTSTTGDMIVCTYYSADGWYCASGSPDGDHWTDGGA